MRVENESGSYVREREARFFKRGKRLSTGNRDEKESTVNGLLSR